MYKKILVANDGSDAAFRALAAAIDLALCSNAELHMIVVEEIPRFPASIEEVKGEIELADIRFAPVVERSRSIAAAQGLAMHCHVLPGHVVPTIAQFCGEHVCDVLVIGITTHSTLYNRVVGSSANRLIELAPCPVMVVK